MEEYNLFSSGFNELLWISLGCVIVGAILYLGGNKYGK